MGVELFLAVVMDGLRSGALTWASLSLNRLEEFLKKCTVTITR